jgi:hypothetical protein
MHCAFSLLPLNHTKIRETLVLEHTHLKGVVETMFFFTISIFFTSSNLETKLSTQDISLQETSKPKHQIWTLHSSSCQTSILQARTDGMSWHIGSLQACFQVSGGIGRCFWRGNWWDWLEGWIFGAGQLVRTSCAKFLQVVGNVWSRLELQLVEVMRMGCVTRAEMRRMGWRKSA